MASASTPRPPHEPDWPLVSIVFLAYNCREQLAYSVERVLEHLD